MKTGKIVLDIIMSPDNDGMDVMDALIDQEVLRRLNLILESSAGAAITDVKVVMD
jgi:hypothetical protein